jgi:HEAT repeat protein
MRNDDPSLEALLASLNDPDTPVRAALFYRLSEPLPEDLATFQATLPTMPVESKRLLFSRLADISEVSFELDFTAVAVFALDDDDAEVRQYAVETLWYQHDPSLMRRFITLLESDESEGVRAAAATALGRFVLAGEFEEIEQEIAKEAEEVLLGVCHAEDTPNEVHRRALESIAFSSRKEVLPLIEKAAKHTNVKMRASALFAMGRNADRRWAPQVLKALDNPEPELRYEATRAVGELTLTEAIPRLIELLDEPDREIKEIAIWSLGEIGGEEAQRTLLHLANTEDSAYMLEVIEDALNMAALATGDFAAFILSSPDEDDFFYDIDDGDMED